MLMSLDASRLLSDVRDSLVLQKQLLAIHVTVNVSVQLEKAHINTENSAVEDCGRTIFLLVRYIANKRCSTNPLSSSIVILMHGFSRELDPSLLFFIRFCIR